ncbi:MAG: hypothetical protein A2664_00130 [Candidatus Taylorbacteria bacterium RIFCSPHIGHO2_01_FULL_46_22b]|uniref:D-glycerate dehydrogenase n=1 Tax=Candidatus Taylorbacteria bacterium RIFCSPHIGHO2_01_FULL_46_22b TaxID=1802301 RepID=A0A1G2M1U4_9BACT|nr:MAG: hypothetical protein A2664_00130 [Candidatus Taylorbacteria bacterium RIFCSPHIGHO2_01_FULL_46_22b]
MTPPRIFVTRPIPGSAVATLRAKGYEVTVNPKDRPLPARKLLKILRKNTYDGVLCLLHDHIDAKVFDVAPTVKVYANYAVGFNNIDVVEAKRRGIVITNTPSDAVNESVSEHTFALLLSLMHRIVEGDKFIREGNYGGWNPNLLIGADLAGKTLGVIGAGRIGTFVLEKAVKAFGMKACYFDLVQNEIAERELGAGRMTSVEELLRVCDVVSLHVSLNETSTHLLNAERIALLKPTAVVINTSRGPVIDEDALAAALAAKKIQGAGLDVFEFEPKISKKLLKLSNVVLTPHTASATETARNDMSNRAAQNLIDFFEGRKPFYAVI